MAADPSHNVHPDLLPHIHLISAYNYPLVPRFGIPEVTEWLLNAPRIARDGAPFFWTFLDAPQNGSVILTWQPLQRMGTEFATDGYVWPRGETYFQHEIRDGLILEVFHQLLGYRPGEEYATHSRRRFRLMPPKVPNPNAPQVDPSLWLVHYGPVDEREPTPVKKIRLDPRLRAMMDHRHSLQRAGQITRKEFMLSDRVNWPQIPLPRDARGPPGYATGGVPQQMAYPPHGAVMGGNMAPAPPAKRARHSSSVASIAAIGGGAGVSGGMIPPPNMGQSMDAAIYDDEEDYARGDMFDMITPRDVSLDRYKQNHEWMEEVISSPYRIGQIGYADLGLGLKGELAPMTEGIFEGQAFDASTRVPKNPYVGRLDSGLADEFRKRVQEKIAATEAEIAEMKARHEELVANLHTHSVIKKGEHDLRFAAEEVGPEIWRVAGRFGGNGSDDEADASNKNAGASSWAHQKHHKTVDEIVQRVEGSLGRKAVASDTVVRVQDGGYRELSPEPRPEPEPEPEPEVEAPLLVLPGTSGLAAPGGVHLSRQPSPAGSQLSGILVGDADMDMGGDTAAGMLDQMESVFSPASASASTPVNFATPAGVQAHGVPPSASGPSGVATPVPVPHLGGANASRLAPTANGAARLAAAGGSVAMTGTAGQHGGNTDDWVVVPPDGGAFPLGGNATAATAHLAAAAPTTAATGVLDSEFGALADMASGGDPMASIEDGLDLNMDIDDSAFGDAFHGSVDN